MKMKLEKLGQLLGAIPGPLADGRLKLQQEERGQQELCCQISFRAGSVHLCWHLALSPALVFPPAHRTRPHRLLVHWANQIHPLPLSHERQSARVHEQVVGPEFSSLTHVTQQIHLTCSHFCLLTTSPMDPYSPPLSTGTHF